MSGLLVLLCFLKLNSNNLISYKKELLKAPGMIQYAGHMHFGFYIPVGAH